eukprot:TRINITY_DN10119_c0_g1_i3.p1 TRINITY_DN10119_c0_g1~~TRINITY_DN10119_c0_g1_i3.p1  ORF type:complete len:263 (-),score=86.52 TRINITY_DN10119_c0_g1_i3:62-850(-)
MGTLNDDTLGFLQSYTKVLGEARAIGSTYVHKKQEAEQELLEAKKRREARLKNGASSTKNNSPENGDIKSVVDRLAEEIEDEIEDPKLYLTVVCTVSKKSFRIKGLRSSSDTSKLLHKISKALVAEDPDLYTKVQQAQKRLAKAEQLPRNGKSATSSKKGLKKRKDDSYDDETPEDENDEKEGGINEKKCFDIPSLLALEMRFLDSDGDTVAVGSTVEWEYAVKNHVDSGRGCLLYTSDAADEEDSVDLGGRRIIKKKKKKI